MRYLTIRALLFAVVPAAVLGCGERSNPPAAMRVVSSSLLPTRTFEASEPVEADSTTRLVFRATMSEAIADSLHREEIGEIMQRVGTRFLGATYTAGLLDAPDEEELVISLEEFDCVLFVEAVLALSQGIVDRDTTFAGFAGRLERMRYREGQLDGYCSRLHYFSEWIHDNEEKGLVYNITLALGGLRADSRLDFMSSNRELYVRLAEDDSLFRGIRSMEASLSALDRWYVPQSRIRSLYPKLRAGDIVATATTVAGLDVSHSGLVYDHGDGRIGFLHASTSDGVTVAEDLSEYVTANRATMGIVVARPVDVRNGHD